MLTDRPSEGYIATPDGERLFYRLDGKGQPLVAIHGGPGFSMSYLRPDLLPLGRKRTLIFYDQRGSGRSSLVAADANISFAKHIDDLETLRRYFALERLTLLGHSWGAAPAAGYAMRHPERVDKLVLVCPIVPRHSPYREEFVRARRAKLTAQEQRQLDERAAAFSTAADPVDAARALHEIYFRAFFADPNLAARIRLGDDPPEAVMNEDRVDRLTMTSLGDYDWREGLRTIKAQTLVIHGDHDPIPLASAHEWAHSIPRAKFLLLRKCGHFPQLEQAAPFFAAIEDFLRA